MAWGLNLNNSFAFVARLLLAFIFLQAGVRQIIGFQGVSAMMTARGFPIHTYAASSGEFGRMARQGLVSLTIWAIVNGARATRFWMVRAAMRPTPLVRRRL